MTELPTGTVTFLFTDIEGSTRLLQRLGERYPELLSEHGGLLRKAATEERGVEVSTEGDSFFIAFRSPVQAVRAAVAAQRALAEHAWPDDSAVRVRMGLHTGEGMPGGDNYVGLDVHRAARIAASAHGGQILISSTTRALVEHMLPEGGSLRDLGDHRLRDLDNPERLYQLSVTGLPSDFPPPKTLDARPNNLPSRLTRFIGRENEIMGVQELLDDDTRLLTLTGPGGTGKTRLSLQVAAEMLPRYEHGAFFVDLSSLFDPGLVASTVADALGVPEDPNRPAAETLRDHLRDRELLLVLDNFEQVTGAAGVVSDILAHAPRVKILVTSRIVLRLSGEQEYPVPPLALPDPDHLPDLQTLSQYEAVALFIDRARSMKPDFAVTNENAPAVAEICARLDGLPLAIELAAVRVKLLSPQAMLGRLEQRLPLLTGGARDLPERQRTLRGAIEWSHDLLDDAERRLFARLAAFMGGCTLEAAEAVCGPGLDIDALDGVSSLADESLLRRTETPDGEVLFSMLETIREFASERLAQSGEEDDIRRRHAEWVLTFAEEAEPHIVGEDQALWLDRTEREHDNIRTALRWAIDHGEADVALRTAAPLWRFWQQRNHLREGRQWLEETLAMPGASEPTAHRGKALGAAGSLTYWINDYEATERYYREAVDIFGEVGDHRGLAEALYNSAFIPALKGDIAASRAIFAESLAEARVADDPVLISRALEWEAFSDMLDGRYETVVPRLEEVVAMTRQLGRRFELADILSALGEAYAVTGDQESARTALAESTALFKEADNPTGLSMNLFGFAAVAARAGRFERAARLAGAHEATREEIGGGAPMELMKALGEPADAAREALPPERFQQLWEEGRAMSLDKAVAYALEETGPED
jgi:predicted ATPase/class 3 adenylate cyclase